MVFGITCVEECVICGVPTRNRRSSAAKVVEGLAPPVGYQASSKLRVGKNSIDNGKEIRPIYRNNVKFCIWPPAILNGSNNIVFVSVS